MTTRNRTGRSPWHWLLVIPIVLPLLTLLFNTDEPRLGGFPLFYWLQLAYVGVVVLVTTVVYRRTERGGDR
ncbi:DUF3311 domain-containing protein [Actinoplanes sp. L3-i22]|uniref:DUF3311 domain-containing protein n=1 Tax=Actinoplanes sp. L3-i22 TaxID=2836373 RepID=UPI001C864FAB|nr:DUF3311 domain-containing protein [Actinoplanes sp. L3-i22]